MTSRATSIPMVLIHDPYLNKKIRIPAPEITKSMRLNIDIVSQENYWEYDEKFPFVNLTPPVNQEAVDQIKNIQVILSEVEPKRTLHQWIDHLLPDFSEEDEIKHWRKIANAYHEITVITQLSKLQKQVIYSVLLKSSWCKNFNKREFRKYVPKRLINQAVKILRKQK